MWENKMKILSFFQKKWYYIEDKECICIGILFIFFSIYFFEKNFIFFYIKIYKETNHESNRANAE